MATTFLEPGGDADFGFTLWTSISDVPTYVSDIVHGAHARSIRYAPALGQASRRDGVVADAGTRLSVYVYFVALPSVTSLFFRTQQAGGTAVVTMRSTSGGVLQLWNAATAQIGSDGPTLATGRWYRISLAYTITSTTVNRFEVFVDGVSAISVTNATLANVTSNGLRLGNVGTDTTMDIRVSDLYIDDSSALTDPGNIWVSAKRPFANGTTNNFVTQIGSGNSGYGSGHADEVNERALSETNGWSVVAVGSAVTEEYTIESAITGDIVIGTIFDFMGWVRAKALASETGLIKVGGVTSNIALTSTITTFIKVAGSTTYPAGNTDIGIVTDTTVTTVSLYECGIVFAYKLNTVPVVMRQYRARRAA